MDKVSNILKKTVNGKYKSLPTVNSTNSLTVEDKILVILEEENITPTGVAEMLANGLDDKKSISYYTILARQHNQALLLDVLYYVKDIAKSKVIHNKPAYFQAILRRKGLKTKFRTNT